MGMTYVCERCGTSLHGVNSHVCQIPLVESFNIHQDCLDEKTLREQIAEKVRGMVGRTFNHYPNGATGVYFGKDEPFLLRSEVLAIIEGGINELLPMLEVQP